MRDCSLVYLFIASSTTRKNAHSYVYGEIIHLFRGDYPREENSNTRIRIPRVWGKQRTAVFKRAKRIKTHDDDEIGLSLQNVKNPYRNKRYPFDMFSNVHE